MAVLVSWRTSGFRIDTHAEANCTARFDTKVFVFAGRVIGACLENLGKMQNAGLQRDTHLNLPLIIYAVNPAHQRLFLFSFS